MIKLTDTRGLSEVRTEIARINAAAGETVFNPAATALLDEAIAAINVRDLLYLLQPENRADVSKVLDLASDQAALKDENGYYQDESHDNEPDPDGFTRDSAVIGMLRNVFA